MPTFLSIIFLMLSGLCMSQPVQRARFSAQEVKEDFAYLYKTLEQTHYNLYVNTDKKIFDKEYHRIYNSITDSMSLLEITRLFQPFVALSQLGHCNIGFPFGLYFDASNQSKALVFPFTVSIQNNRLFITGNYTTNPSARTGDEILSVDGIPVNIKLQQIFNFLSGEGPELKSTLTELLTFSRIYWWIYGSKDRFLVTVKHSSGTIQSIIAEGIKASDYEQQVAKTKPVFDIGRNFRFIGDIAYLHPGIFMNNQSSGNTSEHKTFEKNEFISFIDSAFTEIHTKRSKSLVIDLRGNPGGDNAFSDPMIAYFATRPFRFTSAFNVKTSSITKAFWKDVNESSLQTLKQQILSAKDGDTFNVSLPYYSPRTDSLRFTGKVYVLVDRYSYSNTVSVAAIMQDYHFAKVIGEPTADVASTYGAMHEFRLPNSQINVSYPKAFIIRPNGDRSLKGVIPDIVVEKKAFSDNDEILDQTVNYIRTLKNSLH